MSASVGSRRAGSKAWVVWGAVAVVVIAAGCGKTTVRTAQNVDTVQTAEVTPDTGIVAFLEECYAALDNQLSDEVKMEIMRTPRRKFLTNAHFGMGMWIRNNWIYRNDKLRDLFGELDADTISQIILSGYYNYLKDAKKKK